MAEFNPSILEGKVYVMATKDANATIKAYAGDILQGTDDQVKINTVLSTDGISIVEIVGINIETSGQLIIPNGKTVKAYGITAKPNAANVDMCKITRGGSLYGLNFDTSDYAYSGKVLTLEGELDNEVYWRKSRVCDVTINQGLSAVSTGSALYLHCDGPDAEIAFVQFNNIYIQGQYNYGIHFKIVAQAGVPTYYQPFINGNVFSNIIIANPLVMMYFESDETALAAGSPAISGNEFINLQLQPMTGFTTGVLTTVSAGGYIYANYFKGFLYDWTALLGNAYSFGSNHSNILDIESTNYNIIKNKLFTETQINSNIFIDRSVPGGWWLESYHQESKEARTMSFVAGQDIAAYDVVYYVAATGKWNKAVATGSPTTRGRLLIVPVAVANNATGIGIMSGYVVNAAWNWNTALDIYLGEVAGTLTQTAPSDSGDQVRIVAAPTDTDKIWWVGCTDLTYTQVP